MISCDGGRGAGGEGRSGGGGGGGRREGGSSSEAFFIDRVRGNIIMVSGIISNGTMIGYNNTTIGDI